MSRFFSQLKEGITLYWLARTEQERKFLGAGMAAIALALVYTTLVDPAISGRAKLEKTLPQLRQQAAELQALAIEAGDLERQPPATPTQMTRDSLAASLLSRSMTPTQLSMTGEYAKLQLAGVSFANLESWLEAQRRESRIVVLDASFTGQTPLGNVDATLTLHQNLGTGR
jgi:general secretion pathway protein M